MARTVVVAAVLVLSLVASALGFSAPPQLRTRRVGVHTPPAMVLPGVGPMAASASLSELPQLMTALTTAERMEDLGHR